MSDLDRMDRTAKVKRKMRTKIAIRRGGRAIRTAGRVVHKTGTLLWRGLESIPQDNRARRQSTRIGPRRHYRL